MTDVGKVTQIDRTNGLLKVVIEDQGNKEIESGWLVFSDYTNDFPEIGSVVMVTFDNDDFATGLCYGNHFSDKNKPLTDDENIIYHRFGEDMVFSYNKSTQELTIKAKKVIFTGDIEAENITVMGALKAQSVKADSISEGGV